MAARFASDATRIAEVGGLSAIDIARATCAHETIVRAWLRAARSPSDLHAERLVELSSIVERLVRVMHPAYVALWLRKPVALLDHETPIDVIARGECRRVSRTVAALEASGAV